MYEEIYSSELYAWQAIIPLIFTADEFNSIDTCALWRLNPLALQTIVFPTKKL